MTDMVTFMLLSWQVCFALVEHCAAVESVACSAARKGIARLAGQGVSVGANTGRAALMMVCR